VPGYQFEDGEMSDFKLRVMGRIHTIHRQHELNELAKCLGASNG